MWLRINSLRDNGVSQSNCCDDMELHGPASKGDMMSAATWSNADLVRLQKAVLCVNCELISEGLNGHCAACGSEALLGLSRVLGGMIESHEHVALTCTDISKLPARPDYFSAAA